jgi:hypothetical protein
MHGPINIRFAMNLEGIMFGIHWHRLEDNIKIDLQELE